MVNVKNVVNDSIDLNSIRGKLIFDNKEVGQFANDLQIKIAAQNTSIVPVSVLLYYQGITTVIIDILTKAVNRNAQFVLDGTATIENLEFPFVLKYDVA